MFYLWIVWSTHTQRTYRDLLNIVFEGQDFHGSTDDACLAVFEEFQEWRARLEVLAEGPHEPLSAPWWNLMIANCIRNYELATSKHINIADTIPKLDVLPTVVGTLRTSLIATVNSATVCVFHHRTRLHCSHVWKLRSIKCCTLTLAFKQARVLPHRWLKSPRQPSKIHK